MKTHADNQQERHSQAIANTKQYQASSSLTVTDQRPEAIAQRKTQETLDNSPRTHQLKVFREMAGNSPQVKQLRAIQAMTDPQPLHDAAVEEEKPLQGQFESARTMQREANPNDTGLPDKLKTGIESLSGYSMDDVKVHYNSDKPAEMQAHAFAQGSQIHVAAGQEKHLPHEAWHVVQQKQGRVRPTLQMKGNVAVNDDKRLEAEADAMGEKAASMTLPAPASANEAKPLRTGVGAAIAQLQIGDKGKIGDQVYHKDKGLGEIKGKADGDYTVEWFKTRQTETVKANDPKYSLEEGFGPSTPKKALPTKKTKGQKEHEKEQKKKQQEKEAQEKADAQKAAQKQARGTALWYGERNRLYGLIHADVKSLLKRKEWNDRIGQKFQAKEKYLVEGLFADSALDHELLDNADARDTQWKEEIWAIVEQLKPIGTLPTRQKFWKHAIGKELNLAGTHYDPDGDAGIHLTVSGNSIPELNVFDKNVFSESPETVYATLFKAQEIQYRVHVTYKTVLPKKHLYVGGVNGDGVDFFSTEWATNHEAEVNQMRQKLETFKNDMIEKIVSAKMKQWKLD